MQIDFHHGVTYVVARLADFSPEEAQIIAYSAQYVDDATNSGTVMFNSGELYSRIASAHKMLDYRNFDLLSDSNAWIPFHFLPGNGGFPAGQGEHLPFEERLMCKPNSFIAQDMVRETIEQKKKSHGLHRLGIALHVFVDTWAHQGFNGIQSPLNRTAQLDDEELSKRIKHFFGDIVDEMTGAIVGTALPLGHGSVLSYPDRPYLKWSYRNSRGERVERNNPKDFLEAANEMCKAMQRYQKGDPEYAAPGLPESDKEKMVHALNSFIDENGDKRHQQWLNLIAKGEFSFGKEKASYIPKGLGSWKHLALKTQKSVDLPGERFPYTPEFLTSHWRYFHDALQIHRFFILHELLPQYGICIAS